MVVKHCLARDRSGQATVEYAVLLVAFFTVVVGAGGNMARIVNRKAP